MKKLLYVFLGILSGLVMAVLYGVVTYNIFLNIFPGGDHFATMAPTAIIGFVIAAGLSLAIFFLARRRAIMHAKANAGADADADAKADSGSKVFPVSFIISAGVLCMAVLIILAEIKFYY